VVARDPAPRATAGKGLIPTATTQMLSVWDGQITTRVHIAGSGDPVVFLHGASGLQSDSFLDGLAERFTVYAPEHPGTTPGDPDGIRPLDHLWDLILYYDEVFDALGLDAPSVVGHSFGGMVAAEIAATFPRRVSKLVLLSALGLWRDDAPVPNFMVMTPEEFVPLLVADQSGPVAQMLLTPPDLESEAGQTAVIQTVWSLACTGKFIWPIPDRGLSKRLHRITAPTLIVWGHRDNLAKSVYADEFHRRIATSRIEVLENAAHLPQMEQPERTLALVTEFLG
jgi:pimeloyl-ACP methyl ester carboxylesterase